MIRKNKRVSATRVIRLKSPSLNGVWFHDKVILVKNSDSMRIFSSKCTHLGCRINKLENGMLVCPCHGSAFAEDGKVVKGPAVKELQELIYKIDKGADELIIKV
jgi:Rieske Fe-S protein